MHRLIEKDVVLRIGLDVHGILTDNDSAYALLIEERKRELGCAVLDPDEMLRIKDSVFTDPRVVLDQVKPVPDAVWTIHQIVMNGHSVEFVSRSDAIAHSASCLWLNEHQLGELPHRHIGRANEKHSYIRTGDFHVFFDNRSKEAEPLCSVVPFVFLLNAEGGNDLSSRRARLTPWQTTPIIVSGFDEFATYVERIVDFVGPHGPESLFMGRRRKIPTPKKGSTAHESGTHKLKLGKGKIAS